jgi:putative MFS transporter
MYIGAPIGAVIAAIISDRWERKYLIAIAALVIAGFGMLYGLSSQTVPITIFGFLVAMFLQVFAPLLYAYTPEIFPTAIRTSGSGIAYGAGRLANGFGPLLVAYLFTSSATKAFLYTSPQCGSWSQ